MLCRVPTGISRLFGTITVSMTSPCRRTNFTWLPLWLVSRKPARSSRRLISRKGSGLSRPNLDLDGPYDRGPCGPRGLEMQFKSLFQIRQRFLFRLPLTGHIHLQALRDEPLPFAPNRRGKRTLHAFHCFTVPGTRSIPVRRERRFTPEPFQSRTLLSSSGLV